jgi:hypothetical protein
MGAHTRTSLALAGGLAATAAAVVPATTGATIGSVKESWTPYNATPAAGGLPGWGIVTGTYIVADWPYSTLPAYGSGNVGRLYTSVHNEDTHDGILEAGVAIGGPLGGTGSPSVSSPIYYKRTGGSPSSLTEVDYSSITGPGTGTFTVTLERSAAISGCWDVTFGSTSGGCVAGPNGLPDPENGMTVSSASGYKLQADVLTQAYYNGAWRDWDGPTAATRPSWAATSGFCEAPEPAYPGFTKLGSASTLC